jgi:hypothetical protein
VEVLLSLKHWLILQHIKFNLFKTQPKNSEELFLRLHNLYLTLRTQNSLWTSVKSLRQLMHSGFLQLALTILNSVPSNRIEPIKTQYHWIELELLLSRVHLSKTQLKRDPKIFLLNILKSISLAVLSEAIHIIILFKWLRKTRRWVHLSFWR